jgi:hypothetical protein
VEGRCKSHRRTTVESSTCGPRLLGIHQVHPLYPHHDHERVWYDHRTDTGWAFAAHDPIRRGRPLIWPCVCISAQDGTQSPPALHERITTIVDHCLGNVTSAHASISTVLGTTGATRLLKVPCHVDQVRHIMTDPMYVHNPCRPNLPHERN